MEQLQEKNREIEFLKDEIAIVSSGKAFITPTRGTDWTVLVEKRQNRVRIAMDFVEKRGFESVVKVIEEKIQEKVHYYIAEARKAIKKSKNSEFMNLKEIYHNIYRINTLPVLPSDYQWYVGAYQSATEEKSKRISKKEL
uniref:Uncharacterized protein n=1 Tax=Caenorhabditis japonica TaxID=281687 RepID=A0A8R1IF37_CAEJA